MSAEPIDRDDDVCVRVHVLCVFIRNECFFSERNNVFARCFKKICISEVVIVITTTPHNYFFFLHIEIIYAVIVVYTSVC